MKKLLKKLTGKKTKKQKIEEEEIEDELEEDEEIEEVEYEDEEEEESEDDDEEEEESEEEEEEEEEEWLDEEYEEGQLSIDVYQTKKDIVVKSTIAGVKPDDIDISINNDMLTIRGKREMCNEVKEDDYLYRECYWGSFSRSIILPVEIQTENIEAALENGVLTVTLPKAKAAKQISIKVKSK